MFSHLQFLLNRRYEVNRFVRFFLIAILPFLSTSAFSFTLQPMFSHLDPSGIGSIKNFEILNEGADILAVRLLILTRSTGPDGKEINKDASDLFNIYPRRVIVEPNSGASVKVQWKGSTTLSSEQSFRLMAENISLESVASDSSGIKVMFRYGASVYVGDETFKEELLCIVTGGTNPKNDKGFHLVITNLGTKHVIAENLIIFVTLSVGNELLFKGEELKLISGANYLPGSVFKIFIPHSQAEIGKSYVSRMTFNSEY